MDLLQRVFRRPKAISSRRRSRGNSLLGRFWKRCRVEALESRQMLSAALPIHLGAAYFEDSSTHDQVGDVFEITFSGGAPGTQLTELQIHTDKMNDGMSMGDTFFNTAPGGLGVYGYTPFTVVDQTGIDKVTASVENGGMLLVLKFSGFDAGEKLVFSIDVDEMGYLEANAVAEGAEFEGAKLIGLFAAPHYYDLSGSDIFLDAYDDKLVGSGLNLPNDNYDPPSKYMPPGSEPGPVYTAGAVFPLAPQTPLPITLAGHVYEDLGQDSIRDATDPAIGGVTLTLWKADGGNYVDTGQRAVTDKSGVYQFDGLLPGTYRLVETQPAGYLSVGASPGTVAGQSRGAVETADILTGISLEGGDDCINNDFGEIRPSSIAGQVYVDSNGNGGYDAGETLLSDVIVVLRDLEGNVLADTATDAQGQYRFSGLRSGIYSVEELQPVGYYNGGSTVGSVGGNSASPDLLTDIFLPVETDAVHYDFYEVLPASLSGYVYYDFNQNGRFDGDEQGIAGVTIDLLDAAGTPTGQTALTNEKGFYSFADLYPDAYGLAETQPDGYFDGVNTAGTAGGTAHNPGNLIDQIVLTSGISGKNYLFGEIRPASLSGIVFADIDRDGLLSAGDKRLAGVTIYLLDQNSNRLASTQTNDQGKYSFIKLTPGVYGVQEVQPAGYLDGPDYVGSAGGTLADDLITQITLASGVDAIDYNFSEILPASISGIVFSDMDLDYLPGPGDQMLAGVTIYLLDQNGETVATTQTNDQGAYAFTALNPGVYGVQEVQPAGYLDGPDSVGSAGGTLADDLITQVTLGPGVDATDYNFCELLPAKISGYVFQDGPAIQIKEGDPTPDIPALRDGKLTPDDTPLAGVVLHLCDRNGAPLMGSDGNPITTLTAADGYYEFTMLIPAGYAVVEIQPEGYLPGIDTAGSIGGMVVDRYVQLDPETAASLAVDTEGSSIVRIQLMPGNDATDYNFSEVKVETVKEDTPPDENNGGDGGGGGGGGGGGNQPIVPPEAPAFTPGSIVPTTGAPYVSPPMIWSSVPYGGGVGWGGYTWHLSILNGGQPRRAEDGSELAPYYRGEIFDPATWTGPALDQGVFVIADADGRPEKKIRFGLQGAIPVAGDWNGDGISDVGIFYEGHWFFDLDGNGVWDENDLWAKLGDVNDQPVAGDWDGDGKTDIGIFGPAWSGDHHAILSDPGLPDVLNTMKKRPKNVPPDPAEATVGWRTLKRTSGGPLRSDVIDHVFEYGSEGDKAVVGDWNGDGVSTIGIFRNGTWFLDLDGNGCWSTGDAICRFGQEGDVPVVGDWTGDGVTKLGVYRHGTFYLDVNNNRQLDAYDKVFSLGNPGDKPFAGDFTGRGVDTVGVYQDGSPTPTPASAPAPVAAE